MEDMPDEKGVSEELTFEEAYRQIEKIVQALESGRGGLEESLEEYEKAVRLVSLCRKKLDAASQRIEALKGLDADGEPILEKIDPESLRADTDVAGRRSRSKSGSNGGTAGASAPLQGDLDDAPPF